MAVGDLGRTFILVAIGLFGLALCGWAFCRAPSGARRFASFALPAGFAAYVILAGGSVLPSFYFQGFAWTGAIGLGLIATAGYLALTRDHLRERLPAWSFTAGTVA